ncbi:MAG: hypothetical protein LBE17_04300 [Treponema sp.]|nr:hypothetical protein [Treponema sp.]
MLKNVTVGTGELPFPDSVSFSVFEGEVFGIAGVSENVRQELCEALCGALALDGGCIELMGEDISALSIHDRIQRGLGYVVSNRHKEGLVMEMSIDDYHIKAPGPDALAASLWLPVFIKGTRLLYGSIYPKFTPNDPGLWLRLLKVFFDGRLGGICRGRSFGESGLWLRRRDFCGAPYLGPLRLDMYLPETTSDCYRYGY